MKNNNFFEELKKVALEDGFSKSLKKYDVPENEVGITVEQFLNNKPNTMEEIINDVIKVLEEQLELQKNRIDITASKWVETLNKPNYFGDDILSYYLDKQKDVSKKLEIIADELRKVIELKKIEEKYYNTRKDHIDNHGEK